MHNLLPHLPVPYFKSKMSVKEDRRVRVKRRLYLKIWCINFKIHFHLIVNSGYSESICLQKSNLPFEDPNLAKLKSCLVLCFYSSPLTSPTAAPPQRFFPVKPFDRKKCINSYTPKTGAGWKSKPLKSFSF